MKNVSQITFNGKFKYSKLKSKQTKALNEIMKTKLDGVSSEELLKKMPFDVDVYCMNPSKCAIHPRFSFWISHTKKKATLHGCVKITSKNPLQDNVSKLQNFIKSFNEKFQSLKGDERLTNAEEVQKQVDFLLFGG